MGHTQCILVSGQLLICCSSFDSLLHNILDVELPSLVGGTDQWPTGSVGKPQPVSHLLPKLELLRRNILLHLLGGRRERKRAHRVEGREVYREEEGRNQRKGGRDKDI